MSARPDHEAVPPPELKKRVMDSMEAADLIRTGPPRRRFGGGAMWGLLAAAAFVGGLLVGRWEPTDTAVPAAHSRFILLLHEGDTFRPGAPEAELVAEYAAWARQQNASGIVLSGDRLSDESYLVRSSATSGPDDRPTASTITGYFVVSAPNEAEAQALARSTPHVRYGGSVVVRPIVQ
ncbi:MAG: hypothetical protein HKO77_07770 [Gemmatimonadetes bacterium]|nr:hypothetical protein [Gemmatimonadota bacterium]NNL30905.1 hypothetical protein [Gemmatimonadota bacterium]